MRFRATHLACLMLLLSTLGAAEAHAQGSAHLRCGQHIRILQQQPVVSAAEDAFPRTVACEVALPGSPVAHVRSAWTMRPPAAHTLAQHAVTGSGL